MTTRAALIYPDTPVPGVSEAPLRPEIAALAVPATIDGRNMTDDDFAVTAGWGHYGQGDAVMPGQGRAIERAYTPDERTALGDALPSLGDTTLRHPPERPPASPAGRRFLAQRSRIGLDLQARRLLGPQKWLSYRERAILDRPLKPEEVQHFTDTARRIGGILLRTV